VLTEKHHKGTAGKNLKTKGQKKKKRTRRGTKPIIVGKSTNAPKGKSGLKSLKKKAPRCGKPCSRTGKAESVNEGAGSKKEGLENPKK